MQVEFRFSDLKWLSEGSEPKLQQFTFNVSVRPDPTARTAVAERVSVSKELEDACL